MKNIIIYSYIGLVGVAVGFSASEYIAKGSFSILLFVTLLGAGIALFSDLNDKKKCNYST